MKKLTGILLFIVIIFSASAQKKSKLIEGMYLQWGYNTECFTKSNIHFKMANGDDFTLHKTVAHNRPDYDAIYKHPKDISIPQYNYRIGFYLNKKHSRAIEINFDHAKYIVTDYQTVRVTGKIDGVAVDSNMVLDPATFLHFEHTDGANWLHINYVRQYNLLLKKKKQTPLATLLWKAGAGINIPRTDFTYHGDEFNNDFHVAGYNISVEAGARLYPLRRLFLELTGKTGYAHYINALANTKALKGNRVHHGFGYVEGILTLGYDIHF